MGRAFEVHKILDEVLRIGCETFYSHFPEYLFFTEFLNSCFLFFTVLYSNLDFVVTLGVVLKVCLF